MAAIADILTKASAEEKRIIEALDAVKDPEIPVISLVDLGMIRQVEVTDGKVKVQMTPTFVGCPAIMVMQNNVKKCVQELGYEDVTVEVNYDEAWNTNMITDNGKEQLKSFGLAPPRKHSGEVTEKDLEKVECPNCGSTHTSLNTPFGPTLCRALHHCHDCGQAFQQFKPV